MQQKKLNNIKIDPYILAALKEDINWEDITTSAVCNDNRQAEISLIAKEDGVLAGIDVFKRTFTLLDENISFEGSAEDGDQVKNGETILLIRGNAAAILSAERTALNFLQRMSGIAKTTAEYVKALGDDNIKIMDTRKTTPNMRIFEKYAVKAGGGCNHRYNLSDGFLIKDNHIDAVGGIKEAIEAAKNYMPFVKKIEIEVETPEGAKEAVEAGADIIMLDNMDLSDVKKSLEIIDKRAVAECSGNVTLENIDRYRGSGIDYISVGALTHSFSSMDYSMKNLKYI